jgi:hypothetical protein
MMILNMTSIFHDRNGVGRHVVVCGSFDSTSMAEFLAEVLQLTNPALKLMLSSAVSKLPPSNILSPIFLRQFFHPDHGSSDDMCNVVILGQVISGRV